MQRLGLQNVKQLQGCVLLQPGVWLLVAETCDNLGHSEPEIFIHVVSSILNQLDDDINVPVQVFRKLFCEDGYLKHDLLLELIVVFLEIVKDLVYNFS
jgi:hypothetical protein